MSEELEESHFIVPICGNCGKEIERTDGGWFHVETKRMNLKEFMAHLDKYYPLTPTIQAYA